ncbi:MAG: YihA family ribosome biogenesis GTP-binding protein, partial [bacterium]
ERGLPVIAVATKADKLSRSRRLRSVAVIGRDLGIPVESVIPVSTKDPALSAERLWDEIVPFLTLPGPEGEQPKP